MLAPESVPVDPRLEHSSRFELLRALEESATDETSADADTRAEDGADGGADQQAGSQ